MDVPSTLLSILHPYHMHTSYSHRLEEGATRIRLWDSIIKKRYMRKAILIWRGETVAKNVFVLCSKTTELAMKISSLQIGRSCIHIHRANIYNHTS